MKNQILGVLMVFVLLSCAKTTEKKSSSQDEKLKILTVNYPLFYFAERIGGEWIDLNYVIPDGVDPAFWTPDELALKQYQEADIIFINGADYAKWINNVSLASSRIVNTASSFEKDLIRLNTTSSHSHGPDGEHEHEDSAFTVWLDFELAVKQAEAIRAHLVKKIPDQSILISQNFEKLKQDLLLIHNELLKAGGKYENQMIIGSHPVYQYLARAYNLNMESVHFEPHEFPSKSQWHTLDHMIKKNGASIMLWENQPSAENEKELNDRKVKSRVFIPCGNKPSKGDFLSIMHDNLKSIKN
jgi:zinc transport system substrate-binding protein